MKKCENAILFHNNAVKKLFFREFKDPRYYRVLFVIIINTFSAPQRLFRLFNLPLIKHASIV